MRNYPPALEGQIQMVLVHEKGHVPDKCLRLGNLNFGRKASQYKHFQARYKGFDELGYHTLTPRTLRGQFVKIRPELTGFQAGYKGGRLKPYLAVRSRNPTVSRKWVFPDPLPTERARGRYY